MKNLYNAINFAARYHSNDVRKGTEIPYISHPFAVMTTLLNYGINDEDILIAALTHDLVEDTDRDIADIERHFGPHVAHILHYVTEHKKDLPWEARKLHTVKHLHELPNDAKLVTLADKFHNLHTIQNDLALEGDIFWNRFKRPKPLQKWYYTRVAEELARTEVLNMFSLYKSFYHLIHQVFGSVKYATPHRSVTRNPENYKLFSLGEGFLGQDRIYLSEVWSANEDFFLSYYFAKEGLDDTTPEGIRTLLINENLIIEELHMAIPNIIVVNDYKQMETLCISYTLDESWTTKAQERSLVFGNHSEVMGLV
jgi:hypothetical protein